MKNNRKGASMRRVMIFVTLMAAAALFAAEPTFEQEMGAWHKKAIQVCGAMKKEPVDEMLIARDAAALVPEIAALLAKYRAAVPSAYAKDPNWPAYLVALNEYAAVIRERVEKKQYREALVFCPSICMTFGKMHKINGTIDLTDLMFAWRMEMHATTDMLVVGNRAGIEENLKVVEGLYHKILAFKKKKNDPTFNDLFKPADDAYAVWRKEIQDGDPQRAVAAFKSFFVQFSKPYLSTL